MSKAETYTTYFNNENKDSFIEVFVGSGIIITLGQNSLEPYVGDYTTATIEELEELKDSIEKAISAYYELNPEEDELS
jgi:hypothetical protein